MAKLRVALKGTIFGVLGNHDTICLVPGLEDMGIKVLLNKSETIERGGERIHPPASTTRISTAWTISRRQPPTFPTRNIQS